MSWNEEGDFELVEAVITINGYDVVYWIAVDGFSINVALDLLLEDPSVVEMFFNESIPVTINMSYCSEARARELEFVDYDETRSMWEEFNRVCKPGVFACSEY